jgi:hypothetical protein
MTKGKGKHMRGRSGRRDAERTRNTASGGAFQLGRILVAALVVFLLIAALIALLD